LAGFSPEKLRYHGVVSVREDVSLHGHGIADGALYGIAAAVDLRANGFDDDARRRLLATQV
jgi:hypothetical protein